MRSRPSQRMGRSGSYVGYGPMWAQVVTVSLVAGWHPLVKGARRLKGEKQAWVPPQRT